MAQSELRKLLGLRKEWKTLVAEDVASMISDKSSAVSSASVAVSSSSALSAGSASPSSPPPSFTELMCFALVTRALITRLPDTVSWFTPPKPPEPPSTGQNNTQMGLMGDTSDPNSNAMMTTTITTINNTGQNHPDQKIELRELLHQYYVHWNCDHLSEAQRVAMDWLICGYLRPAKPLTSLLVGRTDRSTYITHPINAVYEPTLSTDPINTPYLPMLSPNPSTHPIKPPFSHTL